MDMIARVLEMDPLELRLKNLLDEGGEFVTGERIHSLAMKECVEKVAEAIQWGKASPFGSPSKARGKGLGVPDQSNHYTFHLFCSGFALTRMAALMST